MHRRSFLKGAAAIVAAPAAAAQARTEIVLPITVDVSALSAIDADLGHIAAGSIDLNSSFVIDAAGIMRVKLGRF